MSFRSKIRSLARFSIIKLVLAKNAFRFWIAKKPETDTENKTRPEVVRETFEELGPTFIKFGQLLSERPDMISKVYADELSKLQDQVPAFDDQKAHETIDEEVGKEKFENLEETPMASASIAQVYRGELRSGKEIVVKVRRPGIRKKIETDLRIMKYISRKAEKLSSRLSNLRASSFVDEFARWTLNEIDMEKEAGNIMLFRENLEDRENEFVPETFPELNTEKVLVMEYVEGVESHNQEQLEKWGVDIQEIAENAIDGGIKQALWDGFFHADLHKSNFLITEEGKIAYLDFGMMGEIDHESAEKLGLMLLYFIREDVQGVVKLLEDLGNRTKEFERNKVRNLATRKVMRFKSSRKNGQSITKQMLELFIEASNHGIYMPANHTLLLKNFITIEGLGHSLHQDFKVSEKYEETIEEIVIQNNSPTKLMKDFGLDLISNKDLVTKMPSKINSELGRKKDNGKQLSKAENPLVLPTLIASSTAMIIASQPGTGLLLQIGGTTAALALYAALR